MNKVSGCAHICVNTYKYVHKNLYLKSIVLAHYITLIEDFNTYCHLINKEF